MRVSASDGAIIEEMTYEGYGPHGVALLIQTLSDNRNRTVSELRRSLTRGGGNLGESGSVGWLFETKGYISIPLEGVNQDKLFELALEAGAEDVVFGEESAEIYTAADRSAGGAAGVPGREVQDRERRADDGCQDRWSS